MNSQPVSAGTTINSRAWRVGGVPDYPYQFNRYNSIGNYGNMIGLEK